VCVTTKKINDDVVASQKSAKILSDPTHHEPQPRKILFLNQENQEKFIMGYQWRFGMVRRDFKIHVLNSEFSDSGNFTGSL
jgi:hypothetical protein